MGKTVLNSVKNVYQYIISISVIISVASLCYLSSNLIDYKVVALVLMVTVSLTAMFFDIMPVLVSALLSALIWNFFFISPKFTFHIDNAEDILLFFMYFIIALVNAVLTFKIRAIEKIASKKEEKENSLKLYKTLLNSLSHELRTPIATIIGATDNLQTENTNLSENNKAELIAAISKATLRLNTQVENLLNMSRLESGTIQLKRDWCDVNELVYTSVQKLEQELGNRKIIIAVENNIPLCRLDFNLMGEVLNNLLVNANLYAPDGCLIKIKASFIEDYLTIIVEDNGHGFEPDEIEKVFEKFYRSKNTKPGGTGLGLSIAKGFIEAHNGKIKLQNLHSGGAEFTIQLPVETNYLNYLKNE